ncbi:hypothetical protein HYFRA_00000645 [Hymenoscyphus fraxineus]|uniref:Uncharacterized protein n=1 Tax=Hymenoscyphus fraxineus TaxID=746836 RepID=A0A9N9L5U9_9HELO|nr:hypothetical protein HYFRA_00000645 [Hymenoscyphus fraxineus]
MPMPSIRSVMSRSYSKLSSGSDEVMKLAPNSPIPEVHVNIDPPFMTLSELLNTKSTIAIELENVLYNHNSAFTAACLRVMEELHKCCTLNGWGSPEELNQANSDAMEASRTANVDIKPTNHYYDARNRVSAMAKVYPIDTKSKEYKNMKIDLLRKLADDFTQTFGEHIYLTENALLLLQKLQLRGKKVILVEKSSHYLASDVGKKLGIHGYVNKRIGAPMKEFKHLKSSLKELKTYAEDTIYIGSAFREEPPAPYATQIMCEWYGECRERRSWDRGIAWISGYYYAYSLGAICEALDASEESSASQQSKTVQPVEINVNTPDSGANPTPGLTAQQNGKEGKKQKKKKNGNKKKSCIVS